MYDIHIRCIYKVAVVVRGNEGGCYCYIYCICLLTIAAVIAMMISIYTTLITANIFCTNIICIDILYNVE